jgi:ribosomal protein S27E
MLRFFRIWDATAQIAGTNVRSDRIGRKSRMSELESTTLRVACPACSNENVFTAAHMLSAPALSCQTCETSFSVSPEVFALLLVKASIGEDGS